MFDWRGYITDVARSIVAVCSLVGAICAFLENCILPGIAFVIIYVVADINEELYYILDDDDDDTEKKE